MYHIFYLYRVANQHVDRFFQIVGEAAEIYRKQGATDSVVMRITQQAGKYGCEGLFDQGSISPDEQLFIGIDSFHSAEQFHALAPKIDSDSQIGRLFQEIQGIVDFEKLIRWEADEIV